VIGNSQISKREGEEAKQLINKILDRMPG